MLLKHPKGQLAKKFAQYVARDPKLRKVVAAVKKDFNKSDLTAHNWEHIWRDTLNAIVIGEAEKANMKIVLPAIVMHDIGFLYGAIGKTHGAIGAQKLPAFLKKHNISYDKVSVAHMAECIRTHKGSMHNEKPETLEAKVVADADLLEKFGYFGIYQYIRTFTEFDYPLEKIIKRNEGMKTLRMETQTGKKLADPGRKLIIDFFNQLDKALNSYRE